VPLADGNEIGLTWSLGSAVRVWLSVPCDVRKVRVVDLMGNGRVVRARNGTLRLRLDGVAAFLLPQGGTSLRGLSVVRARRARTLRTVCRQRRSATDHRTTRSQTPRIPRRDSLIYARTELLVKTIPATKFRKQCLAILDRLGPEGIVITKHGRPVAKLIPLGADSASLIGSLRGKLRIKGDILSTGVRWDAES
jgi:antitoxin (DNA-binding transcriptional repressor) of toxin-antitoxin stability system